MPLYSAVAQSDIDSPKRMANKYLKVNHMIILSETVVRSIVRDNEYSGHLSVRPDIAIMFII